MLGFCSIRLLVASMQGSLIKSIQESTGASIRVLPGDEVPFYVAAIQRANIGYIHRTSGAILIMQESRVPDETIVERKGTSSQVQTAQQLIQVRDLGLLKDRLHMLWLLVLNKWMRIIIKESMILLMSRFQQRNMYTPEQNFSIESDLAMKGTASTIKQKQGVVKSKTLDKQEHLWEISRALAVLASASLVSREREEFLRLVRKEMELYDSMVGKEGTEGEQEDMKAYKAARKESDGAIEAINDKVSSALVNRVDMMLQTLEKEINDVDAKIGDL